jgi:hypothetical protein
MLLSIGFQGALEGSVKGLFKLVVNIFRMRLCVLNKDEG